MRRSARCPQATGRRPARPARRACPAPANPRATHPRRRPRRLHCGPSGPATATTRRESRARLAVLLQGKALNDPAADIARHFEYGGKIKRIHVTADQLKALNAGELGVVQLDGRYVLVAAASLAEADEDSQPYSAEKV